MKKKTYTSLRFTFFLFKYEAHASDIIVNKLYYKKL